MYQLQETVDLFLFSNFSATRLFVVASCARRVVGRMELWPDMSVAAGDLVVTQSVVSCPTVAAGSCSTLFLF